jgi:hypothetical protein
MPFERPQRGSRSRIGLAAAALCLTLLALAPRAYAAAPEFVLRIPTESAAKGSGANQLLSPSDVAGDPETGHLFVSDMVNARVAEFTAWGEFVKAWGGDVAPEGAPGDTPSDQLEVCTTACQAGDEGSGPGQLSVPRGIAVDGAGNIFLFENAVNETNYRVQKFDSDGNWLLMFGGDVNKTTGADICTKADVEGGDVCGAGLPGTADGWFSNNASYAFIAYGPATGTIFVGDTGRIQEFDTNGSFLRAIPLPGELAGDSVSGLDVDATGNFYLTTFGPGSTVEPDAHKLDPAGSLVGPTFKNPRPGSVAVDVDGNVYVTKTRGDGPIETRKYLPDGTPDGVIAHNQADELLAVATNFCEGSPRPGNVYTVHVSLLQDRAYVDAFGTGPVGCEDPPPVPPVIEAQYATSVGAREAVLRAAINPKFFTDTTYVVEYGTSPCSTGGCTATSPVPLTDKVIGKALTTAGVFLQGLEPGTTYFYRFVAKSPGGEAVGVDQTFRTFATSGPAAACPNDALRSGAGASLPDCRAYEMVSPLDKNNGDVVSGVTISVEPTAFYQVATSGQRFTYSSASSFADPKGAPYTSQYLATRSPLGSPAAGWSSESISPPRTRVATLVDFQKNQFKAFSDDLCLGWLRNDADPPLAPGAQPEYSNLYRRTNCGAVGYEALTVGKPVTFKPVYQNTNLQFVVEFEGVSEGGSKAIFVANDNLEGTEAPDIGATTLTYNDNIQLYEHTKDGGLRFACILPSGNPVKEACGAGTTTTIGDMPSNQLSNLDDAISADGSRVFWTASSHMGENGGAGRIYLRIEGTSTVAVSVPVSPDPARFWGATEDGAVAIYSFVAGSHKGELFRFDTATKTSQQIGEGAISVMGMSEDAARVYFASTAALETGAVAGESNLYLWEEGATSLIATIPEDNPHTFSPIAFAPGHRTSRVSPDGRYAAFTSEGPLTGYDNLDTATGQPDSEVFRYDATTDSLVCVSCNPSGARPSGQGGVAARIVPWMHSLYAPNVLSDDGQRVFFESFEALVLSDTNGAKDVYQWEAAGAGSCDGADAGFNPETGGCVELISSGQSPRESLFLDATPSGSDVFVSTLSSLVPWDPDSVDVYDARVGGGFPPPPGRPPVCEGEACQSPASAPEARNPASLLVGPPAKAKRCPKGKRRVKRAGKVRCVKRHRKGARKRKGTRR